MEWMHGWMDEWIHVDDDDDDDDDMQSNMKESSV